MPTAPAVQLLNGLKSKLAAMTDSEGDVVFSEVIISDFEPPWTSYPSVLIFPVSPEDNDGQGTMQARIRIFQDYVLEEEAVTGLLQLAYDTMVYLQQRFSLGEIANGAGLAVLKQIEYGNDPQGAEGGIAPARWVTLTVRPQWLDDHDL